MKRLPTLTPRQRRALLALEWVLLLGIVGYSIWKWQTPKDVTEEEEERREWLSKPAKPFVYAEKEEAVESFPFDPNVADSTTLLRLGLSKWQVRSIYRYRAKHGRYSKPEDFMNVPHLTNEQWERLRPYIRISTEYQYVESAVSVEEERWQAQEAERREAEEVHEDSFPKQPKIAFGQTIDINLADTSQLKMIPGIGTKRAARIVAYRRQLGGFVKVEQAMEAIELPDSVLKYMTVSPVEPTKINVNKLSVQQMMKHPYLTFYQAEVIWEHRQNKGELQSIDELSHLKYFKATDLDRLRPYISFE